MESLTNNQLQSAVTTNPSSNQNATGTSTAHLQITNYDPNVDYVINDYMERLGTRLNILETELKYAWRALDLLSQEYVKMWERLEKLEGLLYEQQSVISQLLEFYSNGGSVVDFEAHAQDGCSSLMDNRLGQLEVIREILGNGTVEDGLEEGVDVTRTSSTSNALTTSTKLDLELAELDMEEMRIPDEAFYRSLNQAYRDDLVSTDENGHTTLEQSSSRPSSQLGLIWEEAEENDENLLIKKNINSMEDESQEVFSAMDYKDYRGNSPCISEQDLAQLTRISSIDHVTIEKLHELDRLTTKLQKDSQELKDLQNKLLDSPHNQQRHSDLDVEARALAEDTSIIDEQLRQMYTTDATGTDNWSFSNTARGFDELLLLASNTNIPSSLSKKSSSRLSIADSLLGTDAEVAETLSTSGGFRTPTSPRRRLHIDIATCDPPYTTVTGRLAYSNAVQNAETNSSSSTLNKSKFGNEFFDYSKSVEEAKSPTLSISSIRTRQDGYLDPITSTEQPSSPSPPPPAPGDVDASYLLPKSPVPVFQQSSINSSQDQIQAGIIASSNNRLHSPRNQSPRTSPKRGDINSKANIVAAKSDSGLSSMSGWSSLEKSPGSPKNTTKVPQQIHPTPIFPEQYNDNNAMLQIRNTGPIQVPVCNAILPGGHHLSAFTTVKSPCSLETSEGYGNFVPAPAPCSDINVSPRKKGKHQVDSQNKSPVTTYGEFLYRDEQPTIYSVAGSNKPDAYTSVYTSNSASYIAQTINYPDLIGNNDQNNRIPPEPNYHAHTTICSATTTTPSVHTSNRKLVRGYSTTTPNVASPAHVQPIDNLANHEGYKTAMYRTMFPTGNITDALTYYPTSSRYDQQHVNNQQINYNDANAWMTMDPQRTNEEYIDPRRYHQFQQEQTRQQPIYENQRMISQPYVTPPEYDQSNNWNVQRSEIPYLELDLRNRNIQQQNASTGEQYYDSSSGVIVSQSGYISISNELKEAQQRPESTKSSKRLKRTSTLKSAMSSVSSWLPDLHLTRRHRSHSLPSGVSKEDLEQTTPSKSNQQTRSSTTSLKLFRAPSTGFMSRKSKKRYPLVSTVSGILQKAKRKSQNYSQSLSDPEQSENEWSGGRSPSIAQSEDEDSCDIFQDTENLFARVSTKKGQSNDYENENYENQNQQQKQQKAFQEMQKSQEQHRLQQEQQFIQQEQQRLQQEQFQYANQQNFNQQALFNQQQQLFQQNQQFFQQEDIFTQNQQDQKYFQNNQQEIFQQNQQSLQQQNQFQQNFQQFQQIQPPNQLNLNAENTDFESQITGPEEETSGKSTGSGTSSTAIFATIGETVSKRSGSEKSDDSTTSETRGSFPPVTVGGASMEFAVSRALGKYRRRQSSSVSDEQTGSEDQASRSDDNVCDETPPQPQISTSEPVSIPVPPAPPLPPPQPIKSNSLDSQPAKIQDESIPAAEPSPSAAGMRMNRFFPRHQQSLEIPRDEEDTRSVHSWRSGSRVSSRRQSTEDSIDSEDEWYCYELRKLEEMERQKEIEVDVGETLHEEPEGYEPDEDVKERMSFVLRELRMKVQPKEGVIDKKELNKLTITSAKQREEKRRLSELQTSDLFAKVTTYHPWKDQEQEEEEEEPQLKEQEIDEDKSVEHSSGDTSGPDSPAQSMDELDEEEIAAQEAELARSRRSSSGSTLRHHDRLSREGSVSVPPSEVSMSVPEGWDSEETATIRDDRPGSNDTGTTISLPKIKIDSTSTTASAASASDASKDIAGQLGSKWKLLKALKERKAEEKSNQTKTQETPTTTTTAEKDKVSASSMMSMVQKFYEIHVKT